MIIIMTISDNWFSLDVLKRRAVDNELYAHGGSIVALGNVRLYSKLERKLPPNECRVSATPNSYPQTRLSPSLTSAPPPSIHLGDP